MKRLAWAAGYHADIGPHVFPLSKFERVREALVREGWAAPGDFHEPAPVSDEDALRVHTPRYWGRVLRGFDALDEARLEMRYTPELAAAFRAMAGGSIHAARAALEHGFGANLGGGFHHAFPDHGEGFCMVHDVAIALRAAQAEGRVRKAVVVDTDVHQGNGTAAVFTGDPSVFTFSIHQERNYPTPKAASDLDVGLEDGVEGAEYLSLLGRHTHEILDREKPDLVAYVAGTDPYREDQLGGLCLSMEDIAARDRLVMEAARRRSIPLFVTFAGGYARRIEDTVRMHARTVALGLEIWPAGAGTKS
jgi:acetoin utilization deacetylase AcuC-like enzyme